MNGIEYRKLEEKDIGIFAGLRKRQLIEEGEEAVTDITASLMNYYQRHMADGTFVAWLAVVKGDIIATGGISFVEKPPYYNNPTGRIGLISSMYTAQDFRRKGIAKKLLRLLMNEASNNACGTIYITASDRGAYLYQDFGFRRNGNFFQCHLEGQSHSQ